MCRQDWRQKLSKVRTHLSMTLGAWLRAQGKLMGVTFLILTAGFFFLRVEYALLFALLITIIDALPVFGTGTVLIPWSMAQFLRGDTRCGVGLLLLYAVAALTRQALEPRLLGGSLGLPAGGDAGSALRGLPRDGCGRNDRFSAAGGLLLPALPVHHRAHAGRSAGIL